MNYLPFVGAATLLTLAILLWLLYPLFGNERGAARAAATRRALNAAVYRDQLAELERDRASGELAAADFAQAHDELQQRLLQDVASDDSQASASEASASWTGRLAVMLLLPLSAALLYLWLGNPAALQQALGPGHDGISAEQIDELVTQLAARMEEQPDDPQGWLMLARSSKALHKFEQAARAYERVIALGAGENADVLADYADLLVAQAGGDFSGRPRELIEQALQLEPDHMMALALAGSAAYARDDHAATLTYWGRLQALLPEASDEARSLAATLEEVRGKMKAGDEQGETQAATQSDHANTEAPAASAATATLSGQVSLSPALRDQVQAEDAVFISAHAVDGPRMPLAVLRATVADLPLSFTLDDSLALNPQLTLSTAQQVRVEARVAKFGDATPRAGDLRGVSQAVAANATGLNITIDQLVP